MLKIIASGKGVHPYRMYDPCPSCSADVTGFSISYGVDPVVTESATLGQAAAMTLTVSPCGCTVRLNGKRTWNVYQFDTKQAWNREVVNRELRGTAKES